VFPHIQTNRARLLMNMPVINKRIKEKVREFVLRKFGERPYEVVVGGAPLNKEIENFFISIGFPIAMGYGTTETAPLITFAHQDNYVAGSCGVAVKHMEVKVLSDDPENVAGELVCRGINVMKGYYKNQEATDAVIDKDGWFHTGDLATMDADGHFFVRGRSKNMLLGPNGQNIYPEEIEDKLNSMAMVNESIVIQSDDKLVALVHPDMEEVNNLGFTDEDLENIMEQNRKELNMQIPSFAKVSRIKLHNQEFEKTAKKSIKRYLYQNGKEAVDLLTEKDFSVALEKAGQINQYNETRKDLDKSMTEEANNIVANLEGLADRRSIVLYNEEWHKGVIGIVASRLTEVYYRPAVVLTRTDDMATGSARSVSGFDEYKAIEHCRDLLENFGGHTYAAGLSMKVENVNAFTKRFEEYVSQHILPEQTSAVIEIDAEIDFRDISSKFFSDLKKFNPFGPDNTKPIFCTHHVYDYGTSKVVGRDQEHIKLELVDNKSNNVMNGIAFGQSSHVRYIKTKRSFDICYTIEENTHKRGEVQLQIEDIKPIE
jgi:hypothetical protein